MRTFKNTRQIRRYLLLIFCSLAAACLAGSAQAQQTLTLADYVTYVRQAQAAMRSSETCAETAVSIADTLQAISAIRLPDGSVMPVDHAGATAALRQSPCRRDQAVAYLDGLLPGAAPLPSPGDGSGSAAGQPAIPGSAGADTNDTPPNSNPSAAAEGTGGNTAVAVDSGGTAGGETAAGDDDAGSGSSDASSAESGTNNSDGGEDSSGSSATTGESGAADGSSGDDGAANETDGSESTTSGSEDAGESDAGEGAGTEGTGTTASGEQGTDGSAGAATGDGTGTGAENGTPDAATNDGDAASANSDGEEASPAAASTETEEDAAASPVPDGTTTPAAPEAPPTAAEEERSRLLLIAAIVGSVLLLLGAAAYLLLVPAEAEAPRRARKRPEEVETADEALDLASVLAAEGRYREAVRHLYLASLLTLSENRLITFDPSLTNRELLQTVREHPHLAQTLQPVVATFDRVWYGYQPLTPADYETAVRQIARLQKLRVNEG